MKLIQLNKISESLTLGIVCGRLVGRAERLKRIHPRTLKAANLIILIHERVEVLRHVHGLYTAMFDGELISTMEKFSFHRYESTKPVPENKD